MLTFASVAVSLPCLPSAVKRALALKEDASNLRVDSPAKASDAPSVLPFTFDKEIGVLSIADIGGCPMPVLLHRREIEQGVGRKILGQMLQDRLNFLLQIDPGFGVVRELDSRDVPAASKPKAEVAWDLHGSSAPSSGSNFTLKAQPSRIDFVCRPTDGFLFDSQLKVSVAKSRKFNGFVDGIPIGLESLCQFFSHSGEGVLVCFLMCSELLGREVDVGLRIFFLFAVKDVCCERKPEFNAEASDIYAWQCIAMSKG